MIVMPGKRRVTISLDPVLLAAVDQRVDRSAGDSRSAVIESVLRDWSKMRRFEQFEREIEAYYYSLSAAEQEEDRQWTRGVAADSKRLWE